MRAILITAQQHQQQNVIKAYINHAHIHTIGFS